MAVYVCVLLVKSSLIARRFTKFLHFSFVSQKIELFSRERIIRLETEKERLLAENMIDDEKLGLKEELSSLTVQKRNLETELKLAQNKADELGKRLTFISNSQNFP